MARIDPIELEHAPAKARELLDEDASRGGEPGPMVRTMAQAPALLRGSLDLSRAMKCAHLDRRITERIALAAQQSIGCEYCLTAHTAAALKLGLSDRDLALARQGTATDPGVAAMVAFAQQLIAAPAERTDADVERLHTHGYNAEQMARAAWLRPWLGLPVCGRPRARRMGTRAAAARSGGPQRRRIARSQTRRPKRDSSCSCGAPRGGRRFETGDEVEGAGQ
jgi:AhpD family alkylhydroperoxidase